MGEESRHEAIETLQQGLTFFETVGMPARDLAARTRQEYTNDLTDLIEFLAKRGITKLKQVSLQDLENYQAEMDRRNYAAASTWQRKTYAIKSFFKFLDQHSVIGTNVASRLIPPLPKKAEPRYLSQDEYQQLELGGHHVRPEVSHLPGRYLIHHLLV